VVDGWVGGYVVSRVVDGWVGGYVVSRWGVGVRLFMFILNDL
jgi:hypothetical protein